VLSAHCEEQQQKTVVITVQRPAREWSLDVATTVVVPVHSGDFVDDRRRRGDDRVSGGDERGPKEA
jgi:hypothetical protein